MEGVGGAAIAGAAAGLINGIGTGGGGTGALGIAGAGAGIGARAGLGICEAGAGVFALKGIGALGAAGGAGTVARWLNGGGGATGVGIWILAGSDCGGAFLKKCVVGGVGLSGAVVNATPWAPVPNGPEISDGGAIVLWG